MEADQTELGALSILKERLRGRSFLYEFYFRGKKTLDVGCGEGEFLRLGKEHISGVDSNARAVELLKKEGFQVVLGSVEKLPFPDASFEAIHCRNVIEHLAIPQAYALLSEAARVLKSGGVFVLASEVPTRKFWSTFGHVKPYPPEAIVKLLRPKSREEFEAIDTLAHIDTFYLGEYFKNKLLYLFSFLIAYYMPLLRREYFLVLKKK